MNFSALGRSLRIVLILFLGVILLLGRFAMAAETNEKLSHYKTPDPLMGFSPNPRLLLRSLEQDITTLQHLRSVYASIGTQHDSTTHTLFDSKRLGLEAQINLLQDFRKNYNEVCEDLNLLLDQMTEGESKTKIVFERGRELIQARLTINNLADGMGNKYLLLGEKDFKKFVEEDDSIDEKMLRAVKMAIEINSLDFLSASKPDPLNPDEGKKISAKLVEARQAVKALRENAYFDVMKMEYNNTARKFDGRPGIQVDEI